MSDIESDYSDYEHAKELEGGLHQGRSDPSRALLMAAVAALVIGGLVLVLP
jgi:hypothetical protein